MVSLKKVQNGNSWICRKDFQNSGENEQRIYRLNSMRKLPSYSKPVRAVLTGAFLKKERFLFYRGYYAKKAG